MKLLVGFLFKITIMKEIDFNSLLGKKANLYYNNDLNRFQLGSVLFEVVENEDDGYRSMMDKVLIVNEDATPNQLLGEVVIREAIRGKDDYSEIQGFSLVDTLDAHIWLTFGTSNYDDYYPCFEFKFYPKKPKDSSIDTFYDSIASKMLN